MTLHEMMYLENKKYSEGKDTKRRLKEDNNSDKALIRLAMDNNTPSDILSKIYKDNSNNDKVLTWLSWNSSTPSEILVDMSKRSYGSRGYNMSIYSHIINNPNAPYDIRKDLFLNNKDDLAKEGHNVAQIAKELGIKKNSKSSLNQAISILKSLIPGSKVVKNNNSNEGFIYIIDPKYIDSYTDDLFAKKLSKYESTRDMMSNITIYDLNNGYSIAVNTTDCEENESGDLEDYGYGITKDGCICGDLFVVGIVDTAEYTGES